jgi:hypothetical protein
MKAKSLFHATRPYSPSAFSISRQRTNLKFWVEPGGPEVMSMLSVRAMSAGSA